MSQLILPQHHQVSVVCGMVSAVNNVWQLEVLTQAPVINVFLMVRGDTLPVTSARISADVICLFVRAIRKIIRSRGAIPLERSVPALPATLMS